MCMRMCMRLAWAEVKGGCRRHVCIHAYMPMCMRMCMRLAWAEVGVDVEREARARHDDESLAMKVLDLFE